MPFLPPADAPRCAVVDLGSNSVRLVVFEGQCRNPVAIFNEKAVLRLGRGLQTTGRLNEEGMGQALTVLHRYRAVARAMGAEVFEILATAAVRDARNGPDFVAGLQARLAGVPIHVLSGITEAEYSAMGMLCGIPTADGILADIGGGSLELVRLDRGARDVSETLSLGRSVWRIGPVANPSAHGRSPRPILPRCHGSPGAQGGTSIWWGAPGAHWRASTWRKPGIRCRWCTTTPSAARRRAT